MKLTRQQIVERNKRLRAENLAKYGEMRRKFARALAEVGFPGSIQAEVERASNTPQFRAMCGVGRCAKCGVIFGRVTTWKIGPNLGDGYCPEHRRNYQRVQKARRVGPVVSCDQCGKRFRKSQRRLECERYGTVAGKFVFCSRSCSGKWGREHRFYKDDKEREREAKRRYRLSLRRRGLSSSGKPLVGDTLTFHLLAAKRGKIRLPEVVVADGRPVRRVTRPSAPKITVLRTR